jgi:hypothetical protein
MLKYNDKIIFLYRYARPALGRLGRFDAIGPRAYEGPIGGFAH